MTKKTAVYIACIVSLYAIQNSFEVECGDYNNGQNDRAVFNAEGWNAFGHRCHTSRG